MENKENPGDHLTAVQTTDDYHVSLSDLEPTRGITDCLDDIIFGLCDTSHSEILSSDTTGIIDNDSNKLTSTDIDHAGFCAHLRLTTNADTVYLCDRQSLRIVTTTSTDYADDTHELHNALTSSIYNLNDCAQAFQLEEVRVFPDHAKLSFTVIPVTGQLTTELQPANAMQDEYLVVVVDADEEYRQVNPCIAQVVQAIYLAFSGGTQSPSGKQIQRSVFDQLKRTFNLCSDKITARRQEIFFEDLRYVTVHFEKLLALNAISTNTFNGRATESTCNGDGSTNDSKNRSDPFVWGWQSVASLIENDQYPQALYQQAELWGETFTTALDIHMLREALFRYKEVCEAANLISFDTIKPLCITTYAQSLRSDSYLDTLQQLIEMAVIRGEQLVLEISEKTSVSNSATETTSELLDYEKHLQSCRVKFGVQFGLCEFGTGHSSLLRATTLNPDVIKLSAVLLPDNHLAIDGWADTVSQLSFGSASTEAASNELKPVQILVDGTQIPSIADQEQVTAEAAQSLTGTRQPQNSPSESLPG